MPAALTCPVCRARFHARSDAVYCSDACRQRAYRNRIARRSAALAVRHRPKQHSVRVLTKPDIGATFARAQSARDRAREVCRAAADSVYQAETARRRRAERPSALTTDAIRALVPKREGRTTTVPAGRN